MALTGKVGQNGAHLARSVSSVSCRAKHAGVLGDRVPCKLSGFNAAGL